MLLSKRNIGLLGTILVLSFVVYFLSPYISFFSQFMAKVIFWIALGLGGYLVLLELITLSYKYINEHFTTPMRKATLYLNTINAQRRRIEKLLAFDLDNSPDETREHCFDLREAEFSKEALAPYLIDWYDHVEAANIEMRRDEIDELEEEKQKLKEEIKKLKREKEIEQEDEDVQMSIRKEDFLLKYEDRLHVPAKDLTSEQRLWLEEEGFKSTHQWCIINRENMEFMVKTRHNESPSHAYLTSAIYSYIKDEGLDPNVQMLTTKMPDVVFTYDGKKYAIEIETGKVLQKSKKQLTEKVKSLNRSYTKKGWLFVVTNKNLLAKYRKFGAAVDRGGIVEKINEIFEPIFD